MSCDTPPPVDLHELAQRLGAGWGRFEMPTVYVIARFHAGRMWIAALGTPVNSDGSRPGPEWVEVAIHA